MTIHKRRQDLDDDRLKAAIGWGLGFTNDKTAEFAGVSVSTIKPWKKDPEILRITQAVAAGFSIAKSIAVKDSVSSVIASAEERIKGVFDKSLRLTERAIQKAESTGDNLSLDELLEIHNKITVWASKYAASEAPKRIDVNSNETHTNVHVLAFADARNMIETGKLIDAVQGRALIAGDANVIDVTADA